MKTSFIRLTAKTKLLLLLTASLLISCSSETYFKIGTGWVDTNLKTVYIDTFSVKMSTVKVDSLTTYNKSVILAGKYSDFNTFTSNVNTPTNDMLTGTTTAMSFIEIARPSFPEITDNTLTFDSIVLEMRFNNFYIGDTLQDMHLFVYQLAERINTKEETSVIFFNTTSFRTEDTPLAEVYFPIRPSNTQSGIYKSEIEIPPVRIRLPDDWGQDLFDKIKVGAPEVETSEKFLDYFKGLTFKAGDDVKSIVGFKADSTFKIRLHYHKPDDFDIQQEFLFSVNTQKQFNHISSDRTGTKLNFPVGEKEIDATQTDNQAYLMAGDGLYVKIEFPYLTNMLQTCDYGTVERAILEIKPVTGTYGKYTKLPSTLGLYAVSMSGEAESQMTDSQNQTQTGSLVEGEQFSANTAYTFDVSNFIQNQILTSQNEQMYLVLRLSDNDMQQTVNRLVIGNSDHSINIGNQVYQNKATLKLYYNMYNDK
ncbi:MAG: DUF4270 domain-containing protein [Prevotellaceae bacterium]|jgi:hypothetical protein|nr:DUF4270 domain-containing protein [Prevotellaceae bacterium]